MFAAALIAMTLAGELVRRDAHRDWIPRPMRLPMESGLRTIVVAGTHEFVAEFQRDRISRRIIPVGLMQEIGSADPSGWKPEGEIQTRSRLLRQAIPDGLAGSSHAEVGWPLSVAEYVTVGDLPGPFEPYAIDPTARPYRVSVGLARVGFVSLATRPMWPGFLLLVAGIHAGLLLGSALIRVPRAWRTSRRKRHGCCPWCGYDLTDIVQPPLHKPPSPLPILPLCPECGIPKTQRGRA